MFARSWNFRRAGLVLAAAVLALSAAPALAHNLLIFATADGPVVSGYAYFSGGGRAHEMEIEILGPAGQELGMAKTDENGEFSFTAQYRCDHILKIATPDGHGATFTLTADELADDLPQLAAGGATAAEKAEAAAAQPVSGAAPQEGEGPAFAAEPLSGGPAGAAALGGEVQALRKQVVALRVQLDRFQGRKNLQDIIGGVGYIVGAAGVAFYFLAAKKRGRNDRAAGES